MPPDRAHADPPTYAVQVDDLARRCGFPALAIGGEAVGPGAESWARWIAAADRLQLVRALGALRAWVWRDRGP